MVEDTPRFCRDCKHAQRHLVDIILLTGWSFARCRMSPKSSGPILEAEHLVTGVAPKPDFYFCTAARRSGERCGPAGKKWEARTQ